MESNGRMNWERDHAVWNRTVGWTGNKELEEMWKEVVVVHICLETLKNTIVFGLTKSRRYIFVFVAWTLPI